MTLEQLSNLTVYAAIAVYSMALVAFAASFAARRAPKPLGADASERVLVGADGATQAPGSRASLGPGANSPDAGVVDPNSRSTAGSPAGAAMGDPPAPPPGRRAGNIAISLTWLAFSLLVAALVLRAIWAGRAPWGNMYEFALSWTAAITGVFLAVSLRRDVRWLGLPVTIFSLLTLGAAVVLLYNDSPQLVPALHSYWLIIHVSAAVVSGGAFTVAAATSGLYLIAERAERPEPRRWQSWVADRVPGSESLDMLAYRVHAFVFPLWTFAVLAGAIWAEDAWGRYWGWDPKETWAFITWVIYAGYLHARATAGWRGRRAAMLGLLGFAAFLVNFVGVNIFASGLHSYAGV